MSLNNRTPIEALDQTRVYQSIFDLMGTTSTGYGAIMFSDPVEAGSVIKAADINKMRLDIERAIIHQNGTSTFIGVDVTPDVPTVNTSTAYLVNFEEVTPGTLATGNMLGRLYTQLQFLATNPRRVAGTQLESRSFNNYVETETEWTCTNFTSTNDMILSPNNTGYMATVNWSWFTRQQINYFFNLGGHIRPNIRIVGGRDKDQAAWAPLIAAANEVKFSYSEYQESLTAGKFEFIITGNGDFTPMLASTMGLKHIPVFDKNLKEYIDTTDYSANALIVRFTVVGSEVIGTLHFVAGLGTKSKTKTKFDEIINQKKKKVFDIYGTTIVGRYINVSLKLETDFNTVCPISYNGGISAQMPQTQLMGNYLSATPRPIPQFNMSVGDESLTQVITLTNNSGFTCTVTDIVLSGYTAGTINPSALSIEPYSSSTVSLSYTGTVAGKHRGYVDVLCNTNRLTLFTEILVGSVTPQVWNKTTTTSAIITQEFVVDHAGGDYKKFDATLNVLGQGMQGYSLIEHFQDTLDTFKVSFDPSGMDNGTYSAEVEVVIYPRDSSDDPTTFIVPITTDLVVDHRHLGNWISAVGHNGIQLGLSYDVIDGFRYFTMAIGDNNPVVSQLATKESFASWNEVYRIPIDKTVETTLYPDDYIIKGENNLNKRFGVGNSRGNLITVKNDRGNLHLLLNTQSDYGDNEDMRKQLVSLAASFFYYNELAYRTTQLRSVDNLVGGNWRGLSEYVVGFGINGQLITHFVPVVFEIV